MTFVRVFSLVTVLGWQLLAGGGAFLRTCVGGTAMAASRNCPCAQKMEATHPGDKGARLDRASCCAIERSPAQQPQPMTASSHLAGFEVPPPARLAVPRPSRPAPAIEVSLRDVPQGQGPPVFLKVRSLLL